MTIETWGLIVGIALPLLISVLKQKNLNHWWNMLIAVGSCIGAGLATTAIGGQFDLANIWKTAGAVILSASTTFAIFWKPSGIDTWLAEKLFNIAGQASE
jgi:hypothetical protein